MDFHVHAAPGDGFLPVWEIQREAERRGVDAVAITNHNHDLALRLGRFFGLIRAYPLVIQGQELTTPGFHMAAVGVSTMVDWRLPAAEAFAAVRAVGGLTIAAHPGQTSWKVDEANLTALDGVEVAHPSVFDEPGAQEDYDALLAKARGVRPSVAAIGSSDFHGGTPLAPCRTYVMAQALSQDAVLEAVRRGRTVATCPGGRVTGSEEMRRAAAGRLDVEQPMTFGHGLSTWIALAALAALGIFVSLGSGSP